MKVAGMDPGINGGLALLEIGAEDCQLIAAIDVPTIGVKARQCVDPTGLQEWLLECAPTHVFIERSQATPAQGASSGFKYGVAVGMLFATVMVCGIPITVVEPAKWKRSLRLRGKDKEGARQRAIELFPSAHAFLARKKDHQRAEAALIGLYGARTHLLITDKAVISEFTGKPAA